MLTAKIANRLDSGDADWQALKYHIEGEIDSLDSLDGINFLDKQGAAIEGRARVLAKEKLKAILEPFGLPEESTDDGVDHLAKKTGVL